MEDIGLVMLLIATALVGYGWYVQLRPPVFKLPEGSALDAPIQIDELREDPARVAPLADKITSVGVIRMEANHASRSELPTFEAFAVDSNGLPNTFARGHAYGDVAPKARWLADQLDVTFEDAT